MINKREAINGDEFYLGKILKISHKLRRRMKKYEGEHQDHYKHFVNVTYKYWEKIPAKEDAVMVVGVRTISDGCSFATDWDSPMVYDSLKSYKALLVVGNLYWKPFYITPDCII